MAYRKDSDLDFLGKVKSSDLNDLVNCLINDKDGNSRWTEELTSKKVYKENKPNHHAYWEEIAAEIQLFGSNSLISPFRGGKGVLYREVLTDVCDKMKVNYNSKSTTEVIERNFLQKIIETTLEQMSDDEKLKIAKEIGLSNIDRLNSLSGQALTSAFISVFNSGGFKSYQLTLQLANIIWKFLFGKGLSFVANATLAKVMSILTGPVGWTATALWTLSDIAGPAFRVTVPAVMQVALLRAKYSESSS